MMKRILVTLAASTAALLTVFAGPNPAHAAANDCNTIAFCVWTGTSGNFTGSLYKYDQSLFTSGNNYSLRLGSGVNNRGTSFVNNTTHTMYLYDSVNCAWQPWERNMSPGQQANAVGSDWINRVSSIRWNIATTTLAC